MFLNEVMEETRKIYNSENGPIWATPENLPFFKDEILLLFSYSNGSKVPKWKSPPRLRDIRSICVISASYYPFIGLWWAHMKFQSEIYGFWKIEKITFFQGSPLWKLFGILKIANFQCIYKICCSFFIFWDTDIPNMSN